MTRTNEADTEARSDRNGRTLWKVLTGELVSAVEYSGGELTGLSIRINGWDTLVTLRATFPGGPMVAFAGGEDPAVALLRACREAKGERLKWRQDKWKAAKLAQSG